MGRATYIPVTPAVLAWAIAESGLGPDEVAAKVGVEQEVLGSWVSGDSKPKLTDFRRLKNVLKRQGAFFLLPAPPDRKRSYPRFRHPNDSDRTALSPKEIRYVRMAARLQATVAWIARQLGEQVVAIPEARVDVPPPTAAAAVRDRLGVSSRLLDTWKTEAQAQHGWRGVLEDAGILVFLLPLGADSCRGFSLWDDYAPIVAASTHWNHQARVFSLFHELGHLSLRSSSACIGAGGLGMSHKDDRVERWCENFAAAVLIPQPDLVAFLGRGVAAHRLRPGWMGIVAADSPALGRQAGRRRRSGPAPCTYSSRLVRCAHDGPLAIGDARRPDHPVGCRWPVEHLGS